MSCLVDLTCKSHALLFFRFFIILVGPALYIDSTSLPPTCLCQSCRRNPRYVVTRLNALTTELKLCPSEIQDARWVPLAQFRQEASHPILKTVAALTKDLDTIDQPGKSEIIETEHASILPGRPNYKLYHTALPI